ncbi:hypothetical protein BDV33DRAFT_154883 [Aspergillus novoparasiticus]|uniref:Uncharacterized protein n=1 Tax=Aspergillus novoparasiticus TaxID=986946 RepID=A0A5N6F420_9EURO|nr:hypothetical protein BDV33DRAFT_154883 [Aspergillus novoparasiticus]
MLSRVHKAIVVVREESTRSQSRWPEKGLMLYTGPLVWAHRRGRWALQRLELVYAENWRQYTRANQPVEQQTGPKARGYHPANFWLTTSRKNTTSKFGHLGSSTFHSQITGRDMAQNFLKNRLSVPFPHIHLCVIYPDAKRDGTIHHHAYSPGQGISLLGEKTRIVPRWIYHQCYTGL